MTGQAIIARLKNLQSIEGADKIQQANKKCWGYN